ncbi:hypothetical protein DERP_004486 [Dermatophagoides pteronyssinus]|uniref:Uncharacterized protein n=1 Tax=Dermatophagoides pteronyssinus TaxID=6956 RepID=A0ABQ8JP26_DERPT|nr:hypothetical protein DERP_004486 [Dermatophagoides pteronyssinus]
MPFMNYYHREFQVDQKQPRKIYRTHGYEHDDYPYIIRVVKWPKKNPPPESKEKIKQQQTTITVQQKQQRPK